MGEEYRLEGMGGCSLRTFLNLLEATTDTFVWPADDVYAFNFLWVGLLQPVECAQGVYAEGVCAAEEDP